MDLYRIWWGSNGHNALGIEPNPVEVPHERCRRQAEDANMNGRASGPPGARSCVTAVSLRHFDLNNT
jgi:hypothetical protein